MAFYTGYFDESGHETNPLFVFGGLVLDVEDPRPFESDWKVAIAPLSYLHTSPFLAGGEGFEQWNNEGLKWKQDLLQRASKVIAKYALCTFSTALSMEAFRKISQPPDAGPSFDEAVAHPYSLCARYSVAQANIWEKKNSIESHIKMVFENRSDVDAGEITKVFQRDCLKVPSFEGKEVLPLQAADLISVIYARKIMRKSNFIQVEPAYRELNRCLHTSDVLKDDELRGIWERIKPLIRVRPTPPGEKPGTYFEGDMKSPRKRFVKPKPF